MEGLDRISENSFEEKLDILDEGPSQIVHMKSQGLDGYNYSDKIICWSRHFPAREASVLPTLVPGSLGR